jgi:valyl-tRNA synthetase
VTLQDSLIRWKRMCGYNALWIPGTDHAGIATQMVVERELARQGISKHDLGREKFLEKVWEWKKKHGDAIINQLKKLGASPDWKRERFTMDEGLSYAVKKVFVDLYNDGLIYKGLRLINWSIGLQTAVSDLEAVPAEKVGHLYYIKYYIQDSNDYIVIATTRPETMLGDTAVAVHPDDERYKKWIGKKVKLKFVDRLIPIIADSYVDKDYGSGALKVTPAHDFNDYELGKKHNLKFINILNKDGTLNENAGKFKGLKVLEARKVIVDELKNLGDLVKVEEIKHTVLLCQRTETVLEPMLSEQWFVAVNKEPKSGKKPLGVAALEAVKLGESLSLKEVDQRTDAIKIVPESWNATYYHWMENLKDWCISRQLWWGHQIPAYNCNDCKHINVWLEPQSKCEKCGSTNLVQDPDVLDTWFSSALWPFSTLGWPQKTLALKKFYPTSVMETGFDILFFWVARMIMMGLYFNDGVVPFKRVYLHAMVRDEKGQKMSKTKGNVIDPLDIIQDYGADAFRFTLAAMAGQGRDVKLSLDRVDGYKAFCNKLWNAARFVLMKVENDLNQNAANDCFEFSYLQQNYSKLHPVNRYILSKLKFAVEKINDGFENFRLEISAHEVYSFIWNEYCDWYIEFSKVLLESQYAYETKLVLLFVLDCALRLAHPIMPFVTEKIFIELKNTIETKTKSQILNTKNSIMISEYPEIKNFSWIVSDTKKVDLWKSWIENLRAFRGENNVSPKLRPKIAVEIINDSYKNIFEEGTLFISTLSQFEFIQDNISNYKLQKAVSCVIGEGIKFYIPMEGLIDVQSEIQRVEKEITIVKKDIDFVSKKLTNPDFTSKAPQELVEKEKQKLKDYEFKLEQLKLTLEKLNAIKN